MKLKMIFGLALFFASTLVNAQDKMLSLMDCATNYSLYPERVKGLKWIPKDTKYSFIKKIEIGLESENEDFIITHDLANKVYDTLMPLSTLALAIEGESDKKLNRFPNITWIDNKNFWFMHDRKLMIYHLNSNYISVRRKYPKGASNLSIDKESLNIAYTLDGNIYVGTNFGVQKVTNNTDDEIIYGRYVHQREFGITKGLFWAKGGSKLAFYRMDEKRVTQYPIYNLKDRPASQKKIKYPMAGDSSHTVSVGVYNIEDQEIVYLQTGGEYDRYLTNISWDNDAECVYIQELNRGQNHMDLVAYNAKDGSRKKVLFTEKHPKYVEPEHKLIFLNKTKNRFIYQGEKDGYNHLYLYKSNGKLVKQLTKGNWIVTRYLGTNASESVIYFEATKESPLERHFYSVPITGGKVSKLSQGVGTHHIVANPSNSLFFDYYSSTKIPRIINVLDALGKKRFEVLNSKNPLGEYKLGKMTIFPISNTKTALYSRMITPPNFNKNKKYPVFVYLYGGPHAQMVRNTWGGGASLFLQYMAQQGYIVFTLDNRGSGGRGLAFENATHRQLGVLEMEDQLVGIKFLKSLPYVDSKRMAIQGWSFGGFMTTTMMCKNPGMFKVGIAGGPVIDWQHYEIMYTERYMDTPEENPEGYKNTNLLNHADKLQDKLLMIHGTSDPVVLWQHSLKFIQKSVQAGNTNVDYFVYPHHPHNVRGKDRAHLYGKIAEYIDVHINR